MINQQLSRRLDFRRHVFKPAHGRLRAKRIAALRTPAYGKLQQWIVAQTAEIVGVLIAAGDGEYAGFEQFRHTRKDTAGREAASEISALTTRSRTTLQANGKRGAS